MRGSIKTGISFGLTSGIITTIGLMVGLNAGTGLKLVVIGGILTVAIADAFSDALGIHMAEESSKRNGHRYIWEATIATFLTKLIVAGSFIIPFLIWELSGAILAGLIWGAFLLIVFNFVLAKKRGENPFMVVGEHVLIAVIVVVIANFVGRWVGIWFG